MRQSNEQGDTGDRKTCLWLSPHADDIAFSLGCTMRSVHTRCRNILVTVFSVSSFSDLGGGSTLDDVTAVRTREDQLFCEEVGAELVQLGYRDAPDRPGINLSEVFSGEAKPDKRLRNSLFSDFLRLSAQLNADHVYAPLGIGGHIDHRIVHDAAVLLGPRTGIRILFYADQPYDASMYPKDDLVSGSDYKLQRRLSVSADPDLSMMKVKHASFYSSQPAARQTIDLVTSGPARFEEKLYRKIAMGN